MTKKRSTKDNAPDSEYKPLLSILIPTLNDRKHFYNHIAGKLSAQIKDIGVDKVELLVYCDNREKTTGYKRNVLLSQAAGEYVVFVDDDDDVSANYVELIVKAIQEHNPDAIGISGIYTENGIRPTPFITGMQYNWDTINGVYCRFTNHISPIRASIAKQFEFPDRVIGEDYIWTMKVKNSGLIKTGFIIRENIYFYEYRSNK